MGNIDFAGIESTNFNSNQKKLVGIEDDIIFPTLKKWSVVWAKAN